MNGFSSRRLSIAHRAGMALAAGFAGLLLSGCTPQATSVVGQKLIPSAFQSLLAPRDSSTLRIVSDDGTPISNATVLIGTAVGTPFANNLLTTDANGNLAVPAAWTDAEPVTISAQGHVRVTYMAQTAHGQSLVSRHTPTGFLSATNTSYEVTGTTPGITLAPKGTADCSLVLPAVQKQDLLNFSISTLLSPENDEISVLGQTVNIPANVTLPKQVQNYVFNVTLDKPNYRSFFNDMGPRKMVAVHAEFPFKTVVDKIRGGAAFYTLLNYFTLLDYGSVDTQVSGATLNLDVPTNQAQFKGTLSMKSGTVNSDEVLLGAAMNPVGTYLIPTGARLLTPGGVDKLSTIVGTQPMLISVLKKSAEISGLGQERLSAVIIPFTDGAAPVHLPLNNNPTVSGWTAMTVTPVATPANMAALGTYATLATLTLSSDNDPQKTISNIQWEVYANGWVQNVTLPTWPNEAAPAGNKRWSIAFLGGAADAKVDLGPGMLQAVTHVTKSATDFQ